MLRNFIKPISFSTGIVQPPILSKARTQRGLTLVEIIVVLIILSLLFTVLAGGLFKSGAKAQVRTNDIKMSKLKQLIGQYQLEKSSLPPSLGELGFIAEPEDIVDAWNTPYVFSVESGGSSYAIKSLGADKKEGGSGVDADIVKTGP